jgi:hypothetical protein
LNAVVQFAKDEAPELIDTFGEGSETTFRNVVDDILQNEFWFSDAIDNYVVSKNKITFTTDVFVSHMEQAALDMRGAADEVKEAGWKEFTL